MAKQAGHMPLTGSIGNITFSKSPFGYLAKQKSGPTRNAVLKGEQFERTRENAADFKTTVQAATLVRHSIRPISKTATNVWLNGRMNRLLLQAVRSDATHCRGKKAMLPGALTILKGFEINHENTLAKKMGVSCKIKINAPKSIMQVTAPSFIPKSVLTPPDGATHFKIVSTGASLDFKKNTFVSDLQPSPLLAINRKKTLPLVLQHPITAKSGQALLLAVGIVFYKMIDGLEKPLKGGAVKIVEVSEFVG